MALSLLDEFSCLQRWSLLSFQSGAALAQLVENYRRKFESRSEMINSRRHIISRLTAAVPHAEKARLVPFNHLQHIRSVWRAARKVGLTLIAQRYHKILNKAFPLSQFTLSTAEIEIAVQDDVAADIDAEIAAEVIVDDVGIPLPSLLADDDVLLSTLGDKALGVGASESGASGDASQRPRSARVSSMVSTKVIVEQGLAERSSSHTHTTTKSSMPAAPAKIFDLTGQINHALSENKREKRKIVGSSRGPTLFQLPLYEKSKSLHFIFSVPVVSPCSKNDKAMMIMLAEMATIWGSSGVGSLSKRHKK